MKEKSKIIFYVIWPLLVLTGITAAFYWQYFFKGLIPFPGDLLVGSYLPWLDYKWGNIVGVAVKNTLISDIFSTFYLWKVFIADSIISLQWPLWNPFSYAGHPLLANFNSGALNPFNLLMVIFGNIDGWSLLVISQTLGSALSFYLFLRILERSKPASLTGAVIYSLGGFAILWAQFVNVGFVAIWLPLALSVIEVTARRSKAAWLFILSPLLFLIVSAGHFQAMVYSGLMIGLYFFYRCGKNPGLYFKFFTCMLLGIGLGAVQLLPSFELMRQSVRFDDNFIKGISYGLLPWQNLITLAAPDFFGNPSTNNFWGYFNYHETVTYAGILGIVAFIFGLSYFKKLKASRFFLIAAVISLVLQFDNLIGRSIYLFKIPFLWTSAAGRIGFIYLFSVAVVTGEMIDILPKFDLREKIKLFILPLLCLITAGAISFILLALFKQSEANRFLLPQIQNLTVSLRNLVLPFAFLTAVAAAFFLSGKTKWWIIFLLLITLADLFRFGWKYTPFVLKLYVFPETEAIEFINKDESFYRIDRERGEIMPPNTWMGYRLSSPSGYEPLAVLDYVKAYESDLNDSRSASFSRYSELNKIKSDALGKYNVKYLLAIKRNERQELGGEILSYKIDIKDWKKVFETRSVAVLENLNFKERVRITDDLGEGAYGKANILVYKNNHVEIEYENVNGSRLLLADTYFPGWRATLNGKAVEIKGDIRPFRSVEIAKNSQGKIVFDYRPESLDSGLKITLFSLIIWLGLVFLWK